MLAFCSLLELGKVRSLTTLPISASSLEVSWQKPDIGDACVVSGYTISYRLINLDQCDEQSGPTMSTETTLTEIYITGLEGHSTYEISVRAEVGTVFSEYEIQTAQTEESGKLPFDKTV